MKIFTKMVLTGILSLGIASFAYGIDRVGSPQKSPTTDSPAAGAEPGAQKAPPPGTATSIKGELRNIETATDGSFYTVKDPAGKEVRLHVNKETNMEGAFQIGDKIEAQSNASGHAVSIKKASSTGMEPTSGGSGAPGTPGGAGTEKEPKPGSGR
jgi:hypothetical protein